VQVCCKLRFLALSALTAATAPAWAAAPADALASAVRAAFDAPEEALVTLTELHTAHPEDDDVAWWLARLWLEEGRGADVVVLLEGRVGRKVPQAHFGWLRARAVVGVDPARARTEVANALSLTTPEDPERAGMLAFAARLAWAKGDDVAAAAHVRAAGGATPGFVAWSLPPAPLRVESAGHAYVVTARGLAVEAADATCIAAPPAASPVERPGPTVLRADGGACLAPGARSDLAPGADGWVYVAVETPEGEGIFTVPACGAAPRALRRGPGLSSPAWVGGALLWVEGGAARVEAGPLWADAPVLRLDAGAPGLLAIVWADGEPRLRFAASPDAPLAAVFAGDPPISRATWCSSPPAARSPGSPPPPPPRPR
jgi:hypothetical protein